MLMKKSQGISYSIAYMTIYITIAIQYINAKISRIGAQSALDVADSDPLLIPGFNFNLAMQSIKMKTDLLYLLNEVRSVLCLFPV